MCVLVVEADAFLAIDVGLEIEAMGGRPLGPVVNVDEAIDVLDAGSVGAAVVNSDVEGHVEHLIERLNGGQLPHVTHSSSGRLPFNSAAQVPHFTRPLDPRLLLQSLLCEVARRDGN